MIANYKQAVPLGEPEPGINFNDNLIRDYAPALDPDGVPCLYDKISEEYVYNSGSGSFITP